MCVSMLFICDSHVQHTSVSTMLCIVKPETFIPYLLRGPPKTRTKAGPTANGMGGSDPTKG